MEQIKKDLTTYYNNINTNNIKKTKEVSKWINTQRKYDQVSENNSQKRNNKGEHPVTIFSQYIYVVDYGSSVGKEFKDLHLGLVIQNDKGNLYSDTTIVLPITDFKAEEKYDKNVHHKIYNHFFESVESSRREI